MVFITIINYRNRNSTCNNRGNVSNSNTISNIYKTKTNTYNTSSIFRQEYPNSRIFTDINIFRNSNDSHCNVFLRRSVQDCNVYKVDSVIVLFITIINYRKGIITANKTCNISDSYTVSNIYKMKTNAYNTGSVFRQFYGNGSIVTRVNFIRISGNGHCYIFFRYF